MKINFCEADNELALRYTSIPNYARPVLGVVDSIKILVKKSTVLMSVRFCYVSSWTLGVLNHKITLISLIGVSLWLEEKPAPFYGIVMLQIIAKFDFVNFFRELCQVV